MSYDIGTEVSYDGEMWTVVDAEPVHATLYRIKTGIDTYAWAYGHEVEKVTE